MPKAEPNRIVNSSTEQLAQALIERRMVVPAIFLLELSKPLVGCMRELYGMTEGLQRVLFGSEFVPAAKELLSSVERVEELIVLLERHRDAQTMPARGA